LFDPLLELPPGSLGACIVNGKTLALRISVFVHVELTLKASILTSSANR
jgi:hypothetical protein